VKRTLPSFDVEGEENFKAPAGVALTPRAGVRTVRRMRAKRAAPAPAVGTWLLVIDAGGARTVRLEAGPRTVGRAPEVDLALSDPAVAERHLRLEAAEQGLYVEPLPGEPALLNDVQLSSRSLARVGDQISLGQTQRVVFPRADGARMRVEPASREVLEGLVEAEPLRAEPRPFQLLLIESPLVEAHERAALWPLLDATVPRAIAGELGPRVLGLFLPELGRSEADAALARLSTALGREGARFAFGLASFPEDGASADALWAAAIDRLAGELADEEPLVLDPVMTRLWGLLERLGRTGAVTFFGEPGVGRRTLARALHERVAPESPLVELAVAPLETMRLQARAAEGGTVVVHDAERITPAEIAALAVGEARWVFCASRPLEGTSTVFVPPLRDRPAELTTLAESFLSRYARVFGRERRVLSAPARQLVAEASWPGNLRALRNAMALAALATRGAEVSPEALPARVLRASRGGASGDLRSALKATEREVLLGALEATSWNVTRAAEQLGLPRRTVVYRMARLGVRRPAR
jgi:pSer/pThr/pTyr-binding forkhead associated (FHA) protein